MYVVQNAKGELIMVAPLKTVSRYLRLQKPAEDRVLRETLNGGECRLHVFRACAAEGGEYVVKACWHLIEGAEEPAAIDWSKVKEASR